jgi:hypothetical protein
MLSACSGNGIHEMILQNVLADKGDGPHHHPRPIESNLNDKIEVPELKPASGNSSTHSIS